jgi:hypothetical protein
MNCALVSVDPYPLPGLDLFCALKNIYHCWYAMLSTDDRSMGEGPTPVNGRWLDGAENRSPAWSRSGGDQDFTRLDLAYLFIGQRRQRREMLSSIL